MSLHRLSMSKVGRMLNKRQDLFDMFMFSIANKKHSYCITILFGVLILKASTITRRIIQLPILLVEGKAYQNFSRVCSFIYSDPQFGLDGHEVPIYNESK